MAWSVLFSVVLLALGVAGTGSHRPRRSGLEAGPGLDIDWNELVDGLFILAQQQILADNKDELSIADVDETFEKKLGPLKIRRSFHATDGFVNSLSSLHRTGEISLSHAGESLSLTSHIGLKVLRVRFDNYRAEILGATTRGDISASVSSNSIRSVIKFTIKDDGCNLALEEAKIVDLGRFDVRITGLGPLDWLASKIATWVTDNKREDIIEKLENQLRKALVHAIGRFDCDRYYLQLRELILNHIS